MTAAAAGRLDDGGDDHEDTMIARPRRRRRFSSPPPARGFTLLELLVVVVIIGILTATLITVIPLVRRKMQGAQTQSQMVAIAAACQAYYNDFRAYPGPLPNDQVGITYYPSANYTVAPRDSFVYVVDPLNNNQAVKLQLGTGPLGASETIAAFDQIQNITGAENLVLGLLGGLELKVDATTGKIATFAYSDGSLYPDRSSATPLGPTSLNPASPKRFGAYLQVKAGDLSNSRAADMSGLPTLYTDEGQRQGVDSPIPEFLDKFGNPMPILYLRANVGGTAVAAIGAQDGYKSGNPVKDSRGNAVVAQYDLAGVQGYVRSSGMSLPLGVNPAKAPMDHHGMQDLGSISDPSVMGKGNTQYFNGGANGIAYLKDPNNGGTTNAPDYRVSPPSFGNARQKDAFVLISAGPDGLYGTADDIVYPGG